jgi:hypothetical protein
VVVVATDSDVMKVEALKAGKALGIRVVTLSFSRAHYTSRTHVNIEHRHQLNRSAVLEEALLGEC